MCLSIVLRSTDVNKTNLGLKSKRHIRPPNHQNNVNQTNLGLKLIFEFTIFTVFNNVNQTNLGLKLISWEIN